MSNKNHVAPLVDKPFKKPIFHTGTDDGDLQVPGSGKLPKSEAKKRAGRVSADEFDAFYKHLGSKCKPEHKRIDLVLMYPKVEEKDLEDEDDRHDFMKRNILREKFEEGKFMAVLFITFY